LIVVALFDLSANPTIDFRFKERNAIAAKMDRLRKLASLHEAVQVDAAVIDALLRAKAGHRNKAQGFSHDQRVSALDPQYSVRVQ